MAVGHPFLTAYDPLGGTSGSIDPLGALRSYGAIADLLLPNMTTITTRSRYLSMISAALANAVRYSSFKPGPAGQVARRRAVEPFERLWAVACASARQNGRRGAADDLRGVSFAERFLREIQERGQPASPDFRMLKSQTRTAGVATYWTLLRGGELVFEDGGLTREGEELAREFPSPPVAGRDLERLADPAVAPSVSIPLRELESWGNACHLGAARAGERRSLASALRNDDRREAIAKALVAYDATRPLPGVWDVPALRRLHSHVAADEVVTRLALPLVIDGVIALEQFHEAALAVFRSLLWWGTEYGDRPVVELLSDSNFKKATNLTRERASGLLAFESGFSDSSVRRAIQDMTTFATDLISARGAREVFEEVLRRHHRVQSGKLDGGAPKNDWITASATSVGRAAPRHQVLERPSVARGQTLTHPYRLEQFVRMLRETGVLTGQTTEERNNVH